MGPAHPSLYQVNTRIVLHELSLEQGRPVTLKDVPDAYLDSIAANGFDWVWMLGIWQTGAAGRAVSRSRADWHAEYEELLPDYTEEDVCGSPFAITSYVANSDFGGIPALRRFRERLQARGIRLMLDFVPNHTALDHLWARDFQEFYIHGTEDDLAREPANYVRVETASGARIFAHGRDPYFPGWPDTLQLNYQHSGLREAMLRTLNVIADECDGLRCDMAMLVLPDVVQWTWGERAQPSDGSPPVADPFWFEAIRQVQQSHPGFVFMAEAYWDLEWELQQQGFDYTYDKRLYDRLRSLDPEAVRAHLRADPEFQRRSARFLENHDEPRAMVAFPPEMYRASAVVTLLAPGLRFVHEGQENGRVRRASNHLQRRANEPVNEEIRSFYQRLFSCMTRPEVRDGEWQLIDTRPAWEGNWTSGQFIAFSWERDARRLLVTVNYGSVQGQCYVPLPWDDLDTRDAVLLDVMEPATAWERRGSDLLRPGLYLDVPAWGFNVLDVTSR